MLAARIRILVATLWVGSLWIIGYLVAPTLFATLSDRVLAGTIAGSLFRVEAWLSVCSAIILLLMFKSLANHEKTPWKPWLMLIGGMLLCTLIGYFGLQPFMAAIREAAKPSGIMTPEAKMHFGILHGIASFIYLIESILGAILILKMHALSRNHVAHAGKE
jgi:drug/metabolite transporter (DMT)-like permease